MNVDENETNSEKNTGTVTAGLLVKFTQVEVKQAKPPENALKKQGSTVLKLGGSGKEREDTRTDCYREKKAEKAVEKGEKPRILSLAGVHCTPPPCLTFAVKYSNMS